MATPLTQVKSTTQSLARSRRECLIPMACWKWQSICALHRCMLSGGPMKATGRIVSVRERRTFMICYECQLLGTRHDASALCHHCSAALCSAHAAVLSEPVTERYPILRVAVLPLQTRLFLCNTCRQALEQTTKKWNPARDNVGQAVAESHLVTY